MEIVNTCNLAPGLKMALSELKDDLPTVDQPDGQKIDAALFHDSDTPNDVRLDREDQLVSIEFKTGKTAHDPFSDGNHADDPQAAAEAGADYVIVICSGYFAGALAGNRKALKAFWSEVSEKSPIPVIIYNCDSVLYYYLTCKILSMSTTTDPGAAGGIDLDSDLITELAEECPNLAGVKLTYVMSGLLCVSI